MPKKPTRKTLPKNLDALLDAASESNDYAPVYAILEKCLPDARFGYHKEPLLMNGKCTLELAQWAIERGTDINAGNIQDRTALHESAGSRFGQVLTPTQLIELGANIHAKSCDGRTPLFSAANGKNLASVKVLLEHGADAVAKSDAGDTPLEYALRHMAPMDFPDMMSIAKVLLDAGTDITEGMKESVKRVSDRFEFHRSRFNEDHVEETSEACHALCELLGIETPKQRILHDGKSPIVAKADTAGKRHKELWDLLVPSGGACQTVQGEVIRISGRIADEWFRNGGANWDRTYSQMAKAFATHMGSRTPLDSEDLEACKAVIKSLRQNPDSSEKLMVWAVEWVRLNPTPATLEAPSYSR